MPTRDKLILGIILLWFSVLSPWLTFLFPYFPFYDQPLLSWMPFLTAALGIIGMALLIMPFYQAPERMESNYRWVDKAVAFPVLVLVSVSFLSEMYFFVIDTTSFQLYSGWSLTYAGLRAALYHAVAVVWVVSLSFGKGRLSIISVLCYIAFLSLPYPTLDNQFHLSTCDEETATSRMLREEELDAFIASESGEHDLDLSPSGENPTLVISSPQTAVYVLDGPGYMIFLAACTFMRLDRKRRDPLLETLSQGSDAGTPREDTTVRHDEAINRAGPEQA